MSEERRTGQGLRKWNPGHDVLLLYLDVSGRAQGGWFSLFSSSLSTYLRVVRAEGDHVATHHIGNLLFLNASWKRLQGPKAIDTDWALGHGLQVRHSKFRSVTGVPLGAQRRVDPVLLWHCGSGPAGSSSHSCWLHWHSWTPNLCLTWRSARLNDYGPHLLLLWWHAFLVKCLYLTCKTSLVRTFTRSNAELPGGCLAQILPLLFFSLTLQQIKTPFIEVTQKSLLLDETLAYKGKLVKVIPFLVRWVW